MNLQQSPRIHARVLRLAIASALVAGGVNSYAGTAQQNLSVTATIAANCSISTAAVAFGSYDPVMANASADLDGTGTVTVTCTNGSAAAVTLGQGANADVHQYRSGQMVLCLQR